MPKVAGSSPRVRGTRPLAASIEARPRFIPACAGNSATNGHQPPWTIGSSPRVRGTPQPGHTHDFVPRFIPACAGNSRQKGESQSQGAVHPRVCGELGVRLAHPIRAHGSSPRVRGTPEREGPKEGRDRFIPACAGNSSWSCRWIAGRPVHPRVCGELGTAERGNAAVTGSSPRVRGTPNYEWAVKERRRFIPACAGNSGCDTLMRNTTAVHPRVCGELTKSAQMGACVAGSSPRVRGTPPHCRRVLAGRRFIPACAGNSSRRTTTTTTTSVHPRVCGELVNNDQAL